MALESLYRGGDVERHREAFKILEKKIAELLMNDELY